MGPLLHSSVEVCESIELSFGKVSGVVPGIGVLDEGPCAARVSGGFYDILPPLTHWFQWHIL